MARIEHDEAGRVVVDGPGGAVRPDHPAGPGGRDWYSTSPAAIAQFPAAERDRQGGTTRRVTAPVR
jgi:hypothetical protein